MVFEDLHHADPGLLDFIDHLMEWSRGVPITVVTLARPELLDRRPDWGAGKRSFTSIYLEPLPPADMERLLAGLVPGPAGAGRLEPSWRGRTASRCMRSRPSGCCSRRAGSCSRTACAGRSATLDEVAVPETLTALVAARLDGLDPADRALIEDAAVLGQSFSLPRPGRGLRA